MEKRSIIRVRETLEDDYKQNMVFGTHSVEEVLRAGNTFEKLFFQRNAQGTHHIIKEAERLNIPFAVVPPEKMASFTKKNHQGVIGFTSPVSYEDIQEILIRKFEEGKAPFVLILDRITDVRNFGAIARTAECAGVDAILIPTRGAAQVSADAIKTSSGALLHIPICRMANLKDGIRLLKESGLQIVACTEKANESIYVSKVDFTLPTALILGSEDEGVSPEYLKLSDFKVALPMFGKISSLNVSAAGAVCMYEVVRQRSLVS